MSSILRAAVLLGLLAVISPPTNILANEARPDRVQSGVVLLTTGKPQDLERARAIADATLKRDPDNFEAMFLKAEYFRYSLKYKESYKQFEKLIAAAPQHKVPKARLASFYLCMGDALIGLSRYSDSEKCARTAIELDPQATGARRLLVGDLIGLKRFNDAWQEITVVEKQLKDDQSILSYKITCLMNLKRFEEAQKTNDHARALFPKLRTWDSNSIMIALQSGQLAHAELLLNKEMAKDTAFSDLYSALAEQYISVRQYSKALSAFDNYLKYNKNSAIYMSRASLHMRLLDRKAAIADCTEALKLNPVAKNRSYPLSTRAHAYMELQLYEKAIADFTQEEKLTAVKMSPIDRFRLAECYAKIADHKQAIQEYTKLISQEPSTAAHFLRAKQCTEDGNFAQALSDVKWILQKNPRAGDAKCLETKCLMALSNYQAALASINSLLARYPGMPEYLRLRGQILKKLNRNSEGEQDLERAKQNSQD